MDDMDLSGIDFEKFRSMADGVSNQMQTIAGNHAIQAERQAQRDQAFFDTADNTAVIRESVEEIDGRLAKESEDRKIADIKAMRYTKKQDRLNFWLAVGGLVLAAAALAVSIIK